MTTNSTIGFSTWRPRWRYDVASSPIRCLQMQVVLQRLGSPSTLDWPEMLLLPAGRESTVLASHSLLTSHIPFRLAWTLAGPLVLLVLLAFAWLGVISIARSAVGCLQKIGPYESTGKLSLWDQTAMAELSNAGRHAPFEDDLIMCTQQY